MACYLPTSKQNTLLICSDRPSHCSRNCGITLGMDVQVLLRWRSLTQNRITKPPIEASLGGGFSGEISSLRYHLVIGEFFVPFGNQFFAGLADVLTVEDGAGETPGMFKPLLSAGSGR